MKDFPHWFPHFWSAFLALLGSGQGGDALMSKGIRKCWFMESTDMYWCSITVPSPLVTKALVIQFLNVGSHHQIQKSCTLDNNAWYFSSPLRFERQKKLISNLELTVVINEGVQAIQLTQFQYLLLLSR